MWHFRIWLSGPVACYREVIEFGILNVTHVILGSPPLWNHWTVWHLHLSLLWAHWWFVLYNPPNLWSDGTAISFNLMPLVINYWGLFCHLICSQETKSFSSLAQTVDSILKETKRIVQHKFFYIKIFAKLSLWIVFAWVGFFVVWFRLWENLGFHAWTIYINSLWFFCHIYISEGLRVEGFLHQIFDRKVSFLGTFPNMASLSSFSVVCSGDKDKF